MEKCLKCIWLIYVNEQKSICPFVKCAKENLTLKGELRHGKSVRVETSEVTRQINFNQD